MGYSVILGDCFSSSPLFSLPLFLFLDKKKKKRKKALSGTVATMLLIYCAN